MRSLGEIIGHLRMPDFFTKQVLDWLGIWMDDQLRKGQVCDFRVMFFGEFWHLVKDGEDVKKNWNGLKTWEISWQLGILGFGMDFESWGKL